MAELATQEGALGEIYVECPRGHHVHIAWTDRPVLPGAMLDDTERAAIHRFAYGDGPMTPTTAVKCPECEAPLHGMIVQGREHDG